MEGKELLKWPVYGKEEEEAVLRVIRSNQLYADKEVRAFEKEYSNYLGIKHCIAVGNATEGLHLALTALEIGLGDEVIVTPYSWISSASCVLMQNAVPIFCDIEEETFGLDPKKVEKAITKKTKAVICVHMFGYPCLAKEIKNICEINNIKLIEDNSHAHGANIEGMMTGTIGDISVGSLHQRKSLSVGDGGIVSTNDYKLKEKVYRLRSFGDKDLSYNYRMTEFAAAIGRVRLTSLEDDNNVRIKRALEIENIFKGCGQIKVMKPKVNSKCVYYAILLIIAEGIELDLSKLPYCSDDNESIIRWTWDPLHRHPNFNPNRNQSRGLPWKFEKYDNDKNKEWSIPELKVAEKFLNKRIIEFYVHPTYNKKILHLIARALLDQIDKQVISL